MKDSWSVEIDNFDTFLEEAIRNCGEAAIENLYGIQTGGIMLEGIGEVLSFVILSRDLTGSSEEAMKVSMKFS